MWLSNEMVSAMQRSIRSARFHRAWRRHTPPQTPGRWPTAREGHASAFE